MYQPYWGLGESPFRGNFDPRFFHQASTQDEALARLQFLVDERRTLGLLLGEAGSGKSLMLETFARQLGQVGRQRASVNLVGLSPREFLWLLAVRLGVEFSADADEFGLFRALADHLVGNHYQQLTTVLLLDNADETRHEVRDYIIRLIETSVAHSMSLVVVLSAQSSGLSRLGRRLLELCELRIDLESWELDDTTTFIKRSLAAAGRSTPLFSDSGLERLHELGGGIPRRVKQLADLALLAGAGQNLVQIEAETIEASFRELGVVMGPLGDMVGAGR
jgi:general secretion pathway protein A